MTARQAPRIAPARDRPTAPLPSTAPAPRVVVYPESDGKPIADNARKQLQALGIEPETR